MIYDQVKPRSIVWRANIPATQESAIKMDWSVDTSPDCQETGITVYKAGSRYLFINCRPVTMTSAVVKLIEKIIRIAIINYLERYDLLSRGQHDF